MIKNEQYRIKKQQHIEMWTRIFGAREDGINWRGPNCWTVVFLIASLWVSTTVERQTYFGFIDHKHMVALGAWAFAYFAGRVIDSYARALKDFSPSTSIAAKQANEQIKLFATFLNSTAVGIVGVVALKEMVDKLHPNYTLVVLSLAVSVYVHAHARTALVNLKNEAIA